MRLISVVLCLTGCGGLDSFNPAELDSGLSTGVEYGGLVISHASIDFGYLGAGQTATQTLVLSNEGTEPLRLESIEALGSEVFSIDNLTGGPSVLQVDEELALTIRFAPESSEDFLGAVALDTSIAEAPYIEVLLSGTAINPDASTDTAITVSRVGVNFGQVGTNTTATQGLLVENTSSEDIALTSINFSDPVFFWERDLALPYVLRAGSAQTITLNYTPTAEVQDSGVVTLVVDDPSHPEISVSLSGEGIYDCSTCAPVITTDSNHALTDFFVLVGLGNDERSVMIQNSGELPLTIQHIYVNNDSLFPEGTFSVTGFNSPITLDPWETTYITISFSASSSGVELDLSLLDQNTVHILSNSSGESDYLIALSGAAL